MCSSAVDSACRPPSRVKPISTSAVPDSVQQAEAGLGDRVVGRLLVGGERDLVGEFGRHRARGGAARGGCGGGPASSADTRVSKKKTTNKTENAR